MLLTEVLTTIATYLWVLSNCPADILETYLDAPNGSAYNYSHLSMDIIELPGRYP